ncbi:hypothetical protein E4U43_003004, partial [Claviceps pusilla]
LQPTRMQGTGKPPAGPHQTTPPPAHLGEEARNEWGGASIHLNGVVDAVVAALMQGSRHSPLLPTPFPSGPSNAWLGCRFPPKAASWRGTRPDTQTRFRTDSVVVAVL